PDDAPGAPVLDVRHDTIDLWSTPPARPALSESALAARAAASPPRSVRIIREGARELVLPLYPDRPLLLGRDPKCNIVFPSGTVSREHARLWMRDDGLWVIRDLSSRNGSSLIRAGTRPGELAPLPERQDTPVAAGDAVLLAGLENRAVLEAEVAEATSASLATQSRVARRLEEAIRICSRHDLPVFLIGPSGSGKTHVARFIHEASGAKGQFILVNCGRLPTDPVQLQSELLGHAKGAFTGAAADRVGKFHAADGGTLFLDEVEYLPPAAQDFLIDLLDGSGSFAPLGAPATRRWEPPKARIIAASKRTLAQSTLRPDLCQRLAAADVIPLPTLDDRKEDIPGLVYEFLSQLGRQKATRMEIEPDALAMLQRQSWPGQVRELEAAVKVTAAREYARQAGRAGDAEGVVVGVAALREYLEQRQQVIGAPAAPLPAPEDQLELDRSPTLVPHEKRPSALTSEDIRRALEKCGGNKTRAAAELGIAVNTLKARMRALGL
ncbi:MAG TPA: sigma 54-interacting transcriptional regulator, partial [Myxococcales bacterium]|nr:sigma 54-interacting transcriptional regulator [Myxococcales bacterium]